MTKLTDLWEQALDARSAMGPGSPMAALDALHALLKERQGRRSEP
jgi:hypothetical protein